MNLRQTAEVATLIATSAAHIVESPREIPTESLHGYWKQSRTRLKCWFAGLQSQRLRRKPNDCDFQENGRQHSQQVQLIAICREILVSEMLTRVWSTVLIAADRRRQTETAKAAVETVFRGHLEARHEVLVLLADDSDLPLAEQISLDRLRRRIERWTDALIGPMLAAYGVGDFAFDLERAQDFAESAQQETLRGASEAYVPLLLAGVSTALPKSSDADLERAMLNRAIVRSLLSAYPPEAFASDGRLKSAMHGQLDRSSRHPEAPMRADADADPSPRHGLGGLSFIELRRRARRSDSQSD